MSHGTAPSWLVADPVDERHLGPLRKRLLQDRWLSHEHDVLRALHDRGCQVPYPVAFAGWAHGDLSACNLLWWEGRLWFIDLPQAVDLAANPGGLDFLHRDVVDVTAWFARHGVEADPEAVFADLLSAAFG